jgi:hypothetical protein
VIISVDSTMIGLSLAQGPHVDATQPLILEVPIFVRTSQL